MWGGRGGMLYVWIRRQETSRPGSSKKAWTILQCVSDPEIGFRCSAGATRFQLIEGDYACLSL